jgi:hypothetical protein
VDIKTQIRELAREALAILDGAKDAGRQPSDDEAAHVQQLTRQIDDLKQRSRLSDFLGDSNDTKGAVWGDAFVKAVAGPSGEFKALVPSGSVVVPSLSSTLVRIEDRPTSILQLIPSEGLQGTEAYAYLQETARTHAAAPVAVGATKPTSVYSVEKVEARSAPSRRSPSRSPSRRWPMRRC